MKYTNQPTEAQEQSLVMEWASLNPRLRWLHAIPNGGSRDKREGANLKRQGVKKGVSDLCLPLACRGYHGLYIEMKRKKGGTVSSEQRKFIDDMTANGYYAAVCKGAEEAIKLIKWYIGGD